MRATTISAVVLALALSAVPALADDMSGDNMSSDNNMMSDDSMSGDNMMSDDSMGAMGEMGSMTMMSGGEVVAIMPDGHMGTMTMDADKAASTIGMSSPMDHCMMFITGTDGKAYMVDTSSEMAQKECEAIAK